MKISYDPKFNIAYIKLQNKRRKIETHSLGDEVNVDVSSDGRLYGIELLNADKQLALKDDVLTFINEATGKRTQLALKN